MYDDHSILTRYFLEHDRDGNPRRLGQGSQGTVYRGGEFHGPPEALEKRRDVAVKYLSAVVSTNRESRRRFEIEVNVLQQLRHPAILRILDHGEDQGRLCLVTELVDGARPLSDVIEAAPFDPIPAARVIRSIADALSEVHRRGFAHRDVSARNILYRVPDTETTEVKLIDFGWATNRQGRPHESYSIGMVGTWPYMSPEAIGAQRLDVGPPADVWSLGVVLYYALTQEFPFWESGISPEELAARVRHDPLPIERLRGVRCPTPLIRIVERCLEKNVHRRPTAAELVQFLDGFLSRGDAYSVPPVRATKRFLAWRLDRKAWADVAIVALLSMTIFFPLIWSRTQELGVAVASLRNEARAKDEALAREQDARKVIATINTDLERQAKLALESSRVANDEALSAKRHLYAVRMVLAQQAFETSQRERAFQLLETAFVGPGEPDLRGFEWSCLWHLVGQGRTTFQGHEGTVTCTGFSPDGLRLASTSLDGTLRVWNVVEGRESLKIRTSGPRPYFAWAPDGAQIAAGQHRIGLWDASTGALKRWFPVVPNYDVTCLAFSPDGTRLAVGRRSYDASQPFHPIDLFDVEKGELIDSLNHHTGAIRALVFDQEGETLVSGGEDRRIVLWDVDRRAPRQTLEGHRRHVSGLAVSPDGRQLASASWDGTIRTWSLESGESQAVHVVGEPILRTVSYLPDGETIVTAGEAGEVIFLESRTGRPVGPTLSHPDMIWSLSVTRDGTRLASCGSQPAQAGDNSAGGAGGLIKVWDIEQRREYEPAQEWSERATQRLSAPSWANCLLLVDDGRQLLAGLENGEVAAWDVTRDEGLRQKGIYAGSESAIHAFLTSGSPARLLLSRDDGQIQECGVRPPFPCTEWDSVAAPLHAITASSDGRWVVASSGRPEVLTLWNRSNGDQKRAMPGPACTALAISPDHRLLVAGQGNGGIQLFNPTDLALIAEQRIHSGEIHSLTFSSDGRWLLTGSSDRTAVIYDCRQSRIAHRLTGHVDEIHATAIIGQRAVTSSWDRTVRIWDLATGSQLLTLRGATHRFGPLLATPDRRSLIASELVYFGRREGSLFVWRAATSQEIWSACQTRHPPKLAPGDDNLTLARCAWTLARDSASPEESREWLSTGRESLKKRLQARPDDERATAWIAEFDGELARRRFSSP